MTSMNCTINCTMNLTVPHLIFLFVSQINPINSLNAFLLHITTDRCPSLILITLKNPSPTSKFGTQKVHGMPPSLATLCISLGKTLRIHECVSNVGLELVVYRDSFRCQNGFDLCALFWRWARILVSALQE